MLLSFLESPKIHFPKKNHHIHVVSALSVSTRKERKKERKATTQETLVGPKVITGIDNFELGRVVEGTHWHLVLLKYDTDSAVLQAWWRQIGGIRGVC